MTRKTTAYARKARRTGGEFNGAEWLNAVSRCRPYNSDSIPGAIATEPTQEAATQAIANVRATFNALCAGVLHLDDADGFNRLAHALGVSGVRAVQIGGEAGEAIIPHLAAGNAALRKLRDRRLKWGKWEMLPAEQDDLSYALELYETILQASSPAQMIEACNHREAWVMQDCMTPAAINNRATGLTT